MARLRNHLDTLSDERGMTLIELLVVCVLMTILAGITVSLVSTLFNTNIIAQQVLGQQQTTNTLFGFLATKIATAQRPPNSLRRTCGAANCIDYRGIGPDQFLFSSQGMCYRVMWISDLQQIRVTSAGSCTATTITPKRLPNQTVGQAFSDLNQACPTTPNNYCSLYRLPVSEKNNSQYASVYDASLDELTGATPGSQLLVSGITATAAGQPSLTPFVFKDDQGTVLPFAYNSKDSIPYNNINRMADVASITVSAYVLPTLINQSGVRVATSVTSQNFTLQQVCPTTKVVPPPGLIYGNSFVQGSPSQATSRTVAQGSTYSTVDVGDSATTALQSAASPQQNEFISFRGALNVAGPTSGSTGETDVRVSLYQQDGAAAAVTATDTNGNQSFTFAALPPVVSPLAFTTVPVQGKFQVTIDAGHPDRQYFVRMHVRSLSGGTITYSTQADDMWLATQWVASN
jgi:prepilin-type N-terminal cleavage/methylation domain-containing protein